MVLVTRGLVWGRWIYAVGGSPEAAVRNGIPVRSVLVSVYVACGFLAGVAALLTMGKGDAVAHLRRARRARRHRGGIIGGTSFSAGGGRS